MKERQKINSVYFPVQVKNHLILQILLTAIWGAGEHCTSSSKSGRPHALCPTLLKQQSDKMNKYC